jgi:putative heme transporter
MSVVAPPKHEVEAPVARAGDRRRAGLRMALSLALVVVAFVGVLPRIASYGDAWERLSGADHGDLALLLVAALWNLASYWPLLMLALPGLGLRRAAISNQVSTAVSNTVPAGGAWGAGMTVTMYRHWGFDRTAVARALLVTGVWNVAAKLLLAAVAAGLLAAVAGSAPVALGTTSAVVLAVGIGVTGLLLRRQGPARAVVSGVERFANGVEARLGRRARHRWTDAVDAVRGDMAQLVAARWPWLTVMTVVSHLSLFLVFLAALETTGIDEVSVLEAFGVFSFVRVALVVPLTPGGAGVAEVGLAALLTAAGADAAAAVAAVLVFRAVTWGLPILTGAGCWVLWLVELRRDLRGAAP